MYSGMEGLSEFPMSDRNGLRSADELAGWYQVKSKNLSLY